MVVNSDPTLQRCLGLGRASGAAGADMGGKVVDMMGQMTEMLVSKSVVGEQFEIDTKIIKIFAAKKSGEDVKEPFSILDTGITVDLPDSFCLEKMEDNICQSPVGISAISYQMNPRVMYNTCKLMFYCTLCSLMQFLLIG